MNMKNNITEIKEKIKEKIYLRSIMVYRLVCDSKDWRYQKMLETDLQQFSLSTDKIREADKKCTINGKRTWLYKFAIQELIDEGSLLVDNSYCKACQNNYAKSYALTLDKLHEVLKYLDIEIKEVDKREEWNESMPFVEDAYDGLLTNDHFYKTPSQLKRAEKEWNDAKEYAEFCKSKRHNANDYAIANEWIANHDLWEREYKNAVREFEKGKKDGIEA